MIKISDVVSTLPPSGIRAFFDLVIGMKDVISLGVGEPDFPTPWNICETAIHSIEQGITSYTSNKGLLELRTAITNHLRHEYGLDYDPETEILVTVGVSEALDLAVRTILSPGDEVLIPSPSYVSYGPIVTLAGGKPVFIPTSQKTGFKIDPNDINKLCGKKTKAILINYPSNPTGMSYTKTELEKINKIAQKHNLIILSDEVYGELSYDFKHVPWPTLSGAKSHCIYFNGFSKAYAMTGWRIGYAMGPKEIIEGMTKIHQYTIMCAPTAGQIGAIEAIRNSKISVQQMFEEYKRRRNFVINSLNRMGLNCHMPQGAFYAFPSVQSTGLSSMDFSNQLLKSQKVAAVPGTAFGPSGEGYLRISYASSMEDLKEAMLRIEKFIQRL